MSDGGRAKTGAHPALTFRLAGVDDIPVIRSLADRIWRVSYADMLSSAQIDHMLAWMYDAETIAAEIADGVLWHVAFHGDEAVGYLSVTLHDAATAELNKLYLLPAFQGQGYGQTMLAQALDRAKAEGRSTLRLRVNRNNGRALRAYERAGFAIQDAVVSDIGGGFVMDDYVLERRLRDG